MRRVKQNLNALLRDRRLRGTHHAISAQVKITSFRFCTVCQIELGNAVDRNHRDRVQAAAPCCANNRCDLSISCKVLRPIDQAKSLRILTGRCCKRPKARRVWCASKRHRSSGTSGMKHPYPSDLEWSSVFATANYRHRHRTRRAAMQVTTPYFSSITRCPLYACLV